MWALIKLFFDICCFSKAPQDLPYSPALLKVLILIYAALAFLILSPDEGFLKGLFEVACELLLMMLFVWTTLFIYQKTSRYTQVLCAFVGVDALISFFALPAMTALIAGRWIDVASVSILGLMAWHWAICGHIIRHALSQSLLFGLGMAFLYILGSYEIMAWLFPIANSE